jgi:hypothetical protein
VADPKASSDAPAEGQGTLGQAAERIRESAKWLIATFGAVGAILVAGLQLSQIGHLSGEGNRLGWAVLALAVALLGVVLAIGAASSVVMKSFVSLKSLSEAAPGSDEKKPVEGDIGLLGGYETVEGLKEAYDSAITSRRQAFEEYFKNTGDTAKRDAAQAADQWAVLLGQAQTHAVDRASFSLVRSAYRRARWLILLGALLAAAGIALFGWAANPPDTAAVPVVVHTPTEVIAHIDPEDRPPLQAVLGSKCDLSALDAVAVGEQGETYHLASVQTENCTVASFDMTPKMGTVVPKADEGPSVLTPSNPGSGHTA